MTYAEAIKFLYGLQQFGANLGLERAHQLAAMAGNPQNELRFIHIAGTNGKGSTCAMLESIYRAAGLRVGLFTSPHLVSFRERIQVNRQLIPESDLVRLLAEIQPLLARFPAPDHPTMFEVVAVLALRFFARQKCDLVVWETGLGGRLDATNIVIPLASVITNIAFDHTEWLGDTIEKISAEKAGIIKPGVPVITSEDKPAALAVIAEVAREKIAPMVIAPKRIEGMPPPALPGSHQISNAALALSAVNVLQPVIRISDFAIQAGLARVDWPGRLQLVRRASGQMVLLDGAHNLAGAESLRDVLKAEYSSKPLVLVMGVLADKNWPAICRMLAPLASKIIVTPVASKRTADSADLASVFRQANPHAAVSVVNNLTEAISRSEGEPFTVITGSLYLVGEALERLGVLPPDPAGRDLNEWSARKTL